jgi:hypothetical protein
MHTGHWVIAVGEDNVGGFAKNDRVSAGRVIAALIFALKPACEVERHKGQTRTHPLGDQRLDPCLGLVLGAVNPDPTAIDNTAGGGVCGVDFSTNMSCCIRPAMGSTGFPRRRLRIQPNDQRSG